MPESESPPEFDLASRFTSELEAAPADERVYRTALQLYEPTRVAIIADRASCATDTARRHLERLADIGVLERVGDSPLTYRRNESYFEWRKRDRLKQLTSEQLQDQLTELTTRDREFKEFYDAEAPSDVDALDHSSYDQVEEVWLDLSEWETVRQRIRRLEAVRKQRSTDPQPSPNSDTA